MTKRERDDDSDHRYNTSKKGRARNYRYEQSEKGVERRRRYRSRPEVIEHYANVTRSRLALKLAENRLKKKKKKNKQKKVM